MKVLQVLDNLGSGGAQSFIMNCINEMRAKGIEFDFLIRNECQSIYIDEIKSFGGAVYVSPKFPMHFFKNRKYVKRFFQTHSSEYSAIHLHANSLMYMLPLVLGKKHGIPIRIVHSHSTRTKYPLLNIIHYFNRFRLGKYATDFIACGHKAGLWMFGSNNFTTLYNGIEIEKYKYDSCCREITRSKLGISKESFVIGHVGAINKAKNHTFLIKVFTEYLRNNPDSKLVIVGKGSLEESIREQCRKECIMDKAVFTGQQKVVSPYYSVFDVLVFPSIFEGLPFTLIEAQASGLRCVISDVITEEVVLTDLISKVSLLDSPSKWAKVVSTLDYKYDRKMYNTSTALSSFDKSETIKQLNVVYGALK